MFNANFNVTLNDGGEKRSFEYSEWNLTISNRTIKVLAVYRPPYSQTHPVSKCFFRRIFQFAREHCYVCRSFINIRRL